MGVTHYPHGISSFGQVLYGDGVGRDTSGSTYYVDGNSGNDGNDGSSWEKAFKTLAYAFGISHADIARGSDRWARRNTIFIAGDNFTETLVAFPQKTDVIGVGSDDSFHMACIEGNHAPVNTNYGCRFKNIRFLTVAAGPIVTLTSATSGCEFVGCLFDATGTATATKAILTTASPNLKVVGCTMSGAFANQYILFGTGEIFGTVIDSNVMIGGADDGIVMAGATCSYYSVISNNIISCADIFINTGATSVIHVVGNKLISGEALGSSSYVIDLTFACGNIAVGNDVSATIPLIPAS